jgi:hypothetical protein
MVEPKDVWPNHHIPYEVIGLSIEESLEVQSCMMLWEIASQFRVKFINIQLADDKHIEDDCKVLKIFKIKYAGHILAATSSLGYFNDTNFIIFSNNFDRGIILHELGHVLGLIDEILRPDSSLYINIPDNIKLPIGMVNYNKLGYYWYKYPFDYHSVMLYPGESGITKKDGSELPINNTEDMMISPIDAKKVYDIYSDTRDELYGEENIGPE